MRIKSEIDEELAALKILSMGGSSKQAQAVDARAAMRALEEDVDPDQAFSDGMSESEIEAVYAANEWKSGRSCNKPSELIPDWGDEVDMDEDDD